MAGNTLIAKRYAQAVFQIALQKNEIERWQSDLKGLAGLSLNTDLAAAIDNPRFSFEQKSRLLQSQLKELDPLALNLAYILINRGSFFLVQPILNHYQKLVDAYRGIEKAEVISAVPLEETAKNRLKSYLETLTGKKITLSERTDPAIIGGIIARVGGKIIDGSTLSQLNLLRDNLAKAGG